MPKKLLFQEKRTDPNRTPPPRHHFVLEPVDIILVAVIVMLTVWVNWLFGIVPF